jgi:hypothetical protein
MSDDEREMAALRLSKRFPAKSPVPEAPDFKVPLAPNRKEQKAQDNIEALLSQQMDRRGQLLKLKKEKKLSVEGEILGDEDISDLSLRRLQKMMDESGSGGLVCFDESATDETLDEYQRRRQETVSKYKQSLMNEYEEEMRRKH